MRKKFLLAPLAAAALATSAFAGVAGADVGAQTARNGKCENLEFCFYYNSDQKGSVSDHEDAVADLAPYVFKSPGAGQGQVVKNNAASACNNMGRYSVRVYYNSNHDGPYDTIPPRTCRNLKVTYNENASFEWWL